VGKGRALQLILTGETISAQEAYRIGLVNEIVSAAGLIDRAETILKQIMANAPIAVKFSLEAANKGMDTSQAEGFALEASYFGIAPPPKTRRKAPPPSRETCTDVPRSVRQPGHGDLKGQPMASDNIFSGLKVVDLASFIAGPSAAVILSDFGADVIKVEPPSGELWRHAHNMPPQPVAEDPYPWHLANRNKRGMALDLKSPSAHQVLEKLVKWADFSSSIRRIRRARG